ncbi:MAG: IMP dehydrogenase, partial [Myxococcota bacterium]|nr:IMP dehydrogenase [Myxococcota bacterium]
MLPRDVDVRTRLVRQLFLETPLLSSAMDTVTEAKMAVAMARDGGLGVIHKNMSPDDQAAQVSRVKKAMTGVVSDPVTLTPSQSLTEAQMLMRRYNISGLPVVDNHRIVGILTDRDLRFERNLDRKVHEVMTPEGELITCAPGTTLDDAKALMQQHKIEKLLVMDEEEQLKGLITFKDIQAAVRHPRATRDSQGRLC